MQREKENVVLVSIVASAGLAIAKGIVGVLTGSLAILSEAGNSLIDLGSTVMTYVAVRMSGKPADEEHHYGHDKIESVSALAQTAFLVLLSGTVGWHAVARLLSHDTHDVIANRWAFGVIIASIIIDFYRSRALRRIARKTSSAALEADALNFSSDMWSSCAVLVGLGGVWLGYWWADSAAALIVAVMVSFAAFRLGKRTIDTLTDRAPAGATRTITGIAQKVPGVVAVEQVRARAVGDKTFIDITVAVNRILPLDRVAEIKLAVEAALENEMPGVDAIVTTTPVAIDDETIVDRIMVIARNRALAVHHVTVHTLRDKLAVALDLEVDGRLSLAEAHDIADGLEAAIAGELGDNVEVETHIEPLQPGDLSGREALPERIVVVEAALRELAAADKALRNIHDVRVRETDDGEIVNFHCHVDPDMTVLDVHDKVDALERALKRHSSLIKRVIGHAEPMRT
ncbi:MAG TPA: cation diffusion facilitator family transporter [Pseudolabrys sp.]|nr:cation diffusion facilitator family transporter [Pseudolabrys sp.]